MILIVFGAFGTVPKGLERVTKRSGNQRKSRDHPDNSIVEIGQNTENNPGDLR